MFKLITIIALVYIIYRMRGIWKDMLQMPRNAQGGSAASQVTDVMVKCPRCESYFPGRDGVELRQKGDLLRFCSEDCVEKFRQIKESRPDSIEQDKTE